MGQLVDSSVLIALERRGGFPSDLMETLEDEAIAISAITASELLAGVWRADSMERKQRRSAFVEAILEAIPVVPMDLAVARVHSQLWARVTEEGQLIGAHDLLIAATALSHDLEVLTDNVRDFQRVPGLRVQRPAW